jgi:hypothetical protein
VSLAWGAKVSAEFRAREIQIAARIACDPSHLMAAIAFETGRTFNPAIRNAAGSGATGLIQFMPSTAIALGTTVEKLAAMSAVEQLDYVEKYFVQNGYAGRMHTLSDVYMAILMPTAIGKPDSATLISSAQEKAYVQNKGLDLNRDGNITKAEATTFVAKALADGLLPANATIERERHQPEAPMPGKSDLLAVLGGIAGALNPVAGILFQAISPVIKEKIAKEVDRHTDTPGVGQAVADSLSEAIIGKAQQLTGKADPLEAVALVRQQPELVDQVAAVAQQSVAAKLEEWAPLLDKMAALDATRWDKEREGRDAAAKRALAERWDMTPWLVGFAGMGTTVCSALLLAAIVYQSIAKTIDPVLLGLAGPLLAITFAAWKAIFDYRFDGTKESGEQSKALTDVIRQRGQA